jgi:hypothetical protein
VIAQGKEETMLEDFITPTAVQRLRSGVFGDHVEALCSQLVKAGYRPASITHKLWTVSTLARRMEDRGQTVDDLDERCIGKFLDPRRARGRTCRGMRGTALMLLGQLRSDGIISTPEPARDDSPSIGLLGKYEVYLRQERAVTEGTVSRYVSIAHAFVSEHLHEADLRPVSLSAGDVSDFLLARIRHVAPKQAQYLGSALRSFLRYLFL